MKKKYILILLFLLNMACYINVDASSIEYNLTIEEDMEFSEKIVYKVNQNELEKSEKFDFLTSVVKETIYFDNDRSVPYTKTKKLLNGIYTVTLTHEYSSMFLTGSRIINECFSKYVYNDGESLSIELESPFYCSERADEITIKITSDLNFYSSNAQSVKDNTHIWKVQDDSFYLSLYLERPNLNDSIISSGGTDAYHSEEDNNQNSQLDEENVTDEETTNQEKEQEKSINPLILIIAIPITIGVIAVIIIILKAKKHNLNQI